jgi:hypothetical protein
VLEEVDIRDKSLRDRIFSSRVEREENGDGGSRHSGRSMMPDMPSRIAGRSVPDIDWLLRPCSISIKAHHHLFKMFARLSRSSGRSVLLDGCITYCLKNGSNVDRKTLALRATDFDANFA